MTHGSLRRRWTVGCAAVASSSLLLCSQAWSQSTPPSRDAQAATHQAAKDLGRAWANTTTATVRNGEAETATVRRIVPGYTATPAEAQSYRDANPAVAAANRRALCATTPNDPVCSATAIGTAVRPNLGVTAAHPALAGQAAAADPTRVLGDITSTYSACSVGGKMTSAATWTESTCRIEADPWSRHTCTKTLDASPVHSTTCTEGSVIAAARLVRGGADVMDVQVLCTPQRPGQLPGHVRIQAQAVGGRGACTPGLDAVVDLSAPIPQPGGTPVVLGLLQPHWGGNCQPLSVVWEGPGCADKSCRGNVHFVIGSGIQSRRTCSGPGEILGSQVYMQGNDSPESDAQCYTPFESPEAAGGRPGGWGTTWGGERFWYAITSASTAEGWVWSSGERWTAPLAFVEPRFVPAAGDRWFNACAAFEAKTPHLLPDGVAPLLPNPMLVNAPAGTQQCARTSSVCTDGPNTRVINGVPVTRECWSYTNKFDCSQVAPASGCTDPALQACTELRATCERVDALGRCLSSANVFSCPAGPAAFTPALNCGSSDFCADGSCWQESTTPNDGFAAVVSQMQAHLDAAKDIDAESLQIFKGTDRRCTRDTFGLDNCCEADSSVFQRCSAEMQETVRQRDQGRCVQVGDYCSARSLGVCRERTRSYCCFSSLLARLVQQQGRLQVGRRWGSAEAPNCVGFTPEEISLLDWSAFDLSEFYAQINVTPPPGATELTGGAQAAQPRCYFGQGRC